MSAKDNEPLEEIAEETLEKQEPQEQDEPSEPNEKPQEEDFKTKYLRLLAENENLVRRLRKESRDSTRFALQKLILDLLIPLDQLELALGHAENNPSPDVKNWAIGFKMISKQFQEWLSAQDVYRFKSIGQQFDPKLHEASEMMESSTEREGTIMKELAPGYKMGEAVLRPARVIVAKKEEKQESEQQEEKS